MMLQEIKNLQDRAVSELCQKVGGGRRELTFRAPTGSGKTRMMADFMNRVLAADDSVVFLVSTLSKGNLAGQNYGVFKRCAADGTFPKLRPYLVSTDISGEENLFIPLEYNVYVLPRDLYKEKGKLMQGPMQNFLLTMTEYYFGRGMGKRIYLIKDECHQATNNLDALSDRFFQRVVNFSATPNLKRGQVPDVQITDEEAVQAKLIKRVEFGSDEDTIEDAVCKFEEIKKKYISLGVNPCLIIQISNKDKAEEEWLRRIKPVLDKVEHQSLKWMVIVDQKDKKKNEKFCDTNDVIKKRLPVDRWKDYARGDTASIDVIVFKMVISEGWDIPRACMLYQVRDTKSKQLDEQVMGRVRRNPRLLDFETLTDEARQLATTAWVWGIPPDSMKRGYDVKLWGDGADIQKNIRLKTIRLKNLTDKQDFDLDAFIDSQQDDIAHTSIFELYEKLSAANDEVQRLCYDYARENVGRWWKFMENIDQVKRQYDNYICDYDQSMEEAGEVSFPAVSTYLDNGNNKEIDDWVWMRKDGRDTFSFDSEAERRWASVLQKSARKYGAALCRPGTSDGEETCLWGKNFPLNSEIKYEYYANGIRSSYPDFVMKDCQGRVHVFEVKSVNVSHLAQFDSQEYQDKVRKLEDCYLACSRKLPGHLFYLPVLKADEWQIKRFVDGEQDTIDVEQFKDSLR